MDHKTREQIVDMLAAIAEAIIENEKELVDDPHHLGASLWDFTWSSPGDLASELSHYSRDPVGRSLRAGIADIGRVLLPSIEYRDLLAIVDTAAQKTSDPATATGALTHQWDGLHTLDGRRWTV